MWKLSVRATRFSNGKPTKLNEPLLIERPITVWLNGNIEVEKTCSPRLREEWALGYLIANKKLRYIDEIKSISSKGADVEIQLNQEERQNTNSEFVPTDIFSSTKILDAMSAFQEASTLYRETGIAESAALCKGNTILLFAEDVFLEGALYKILGQQFRTPTLQDSSYLILSGKVTADIISLTQALTLAGIVSRSGVTDAALAESQKRNIFLAGFCRGRQITRYC